MANYSDSQIVRNVLSTPGAERLPYFAVHCDSIADDATYWHVIGCLWVDGGETQHIELMRKMLASPRRGRWKMMKKADRRAWRKLPKVMKAYRATASNEDLDRAIAWTLSRKVAERFAKSWHRTVVERVVRKEDVIAYFDRRGEKEILVCQ